MYKILLSVFSLLIAASASFGQVSFSDDFEGYAAGDLLGASSDTWRVWTGGADVAITDANAASGSNAVLFESAGGGPVDIILPFGGKYTSGQFNLKMKVYVNAGGIGYWNFQGEVTDGTTWVMNTFLQANGNVEIDDGTAAVFQTTYEQETWVDVEIDVNLSANVWKFKVNDECLGTFANQNNFIASMNLYPVAGASFYVDDVEFSYDPADPDPIEDIALNINSDLKAEFFGVAGSAKDIDFVISNNGSSMINDVDLEVTVNGATESQSLSALGLMPGSSAVIPLPNPVELVDGSNNIMVRINDVDGNGVDAEPCNDVINLNLTGFTPAENKKVMVEEITGRGCQFCPRGHVFMKLMAERWPEYFVGIAVHSNDFGADPMANTDHETFLEGNNFVGGQPTVSINRTINQENPQTMEDDITTWVEIPPTAYFRHGASFDETTRELTISVTTIFVRDMATPNRLLVLLTEDGITGTGSGYAQTNAYAGGGLGPMCGYESLPSPVPASQMVYDEVSRALLTDPAGLVDAWGPSQTAGTSKTHQFKYTVPADFNIDNLKIVSAMVYNTSGGIDNVEESHVNDAIASGLQVNTFDEAFTSQTEIFPNPFTNFTNVTLTSQTLENVSIELSDAMGKLVARKDYGKHQGTNTFEFDASALTSGVYYMKIINGDKFGTQKVVISN